MTTGSITIATFGVVPLIIDLNEDQLVALADAIAWMGDTGEGDPERYPGPGWDDPDGPWDIEDRWALAATD